MALHISHPSCPLLCYAVLSGPMGVMGAAVLSPDPRMNPTMNGGSKPPKPGGSHSSSHKKKNSPIPANHGVGGGGSGGGGGVSKDHFVLVAAEAMPLSSAGNCEVACSSIYNLNLRYQV